MAQWLLMICAPGIPSGCWTSPSPVSAFWTIRYNVCCTDGSVCHCTLQFPTAQLPTAEPIAHDLADDCYCTLAIGIAWIEWGTNHDDRVARMRYDDADWKGQAGIAHCHPHIVYKFVERPSDFVPPCFQISRLRLGFLRWLALCRPPIGGGIYSTPDRITALIA